MRVQATDVDLTRTRLPRSTAGVEAALDWLCASHRRALALLFALALACFLPGFVSLQPMDRDEPRFAQATKQMLETGDFVAIRFQDEARNKKPVGIYWLQAATVGLAERLGVPQARATIALYRLPSLAGAVAGVLLTYWALLAMAGAPSRRSRSGRSFLLSNHPELAIRRQALIGAALMAATILLGVEARLAKTDAVLFACCVAMMGGLARVYLRQEKPAGSVLALFWGAMALSVLVKGPVAPLIVGLAVVALSIRERSMRWALPLRPLLGLAIVVAAVLPWFIAITIETKGAFFAEAVGKDMLGKVGSAQEKHGAPPGTYLLIFFGTAWPLAPFFAIAAQTLWRDRRDDVVAFALAWIVPAWLLFEAVPTKLPHYVLPLYPAIALLTVRAIARGDVGRHRPLAWVGIALLVLIPLAAVIGLPVAGWLLDGRIPWVALPVLLLSLGLSIWAVAMFGRRDIWRSVLLGIAASVVFSIAVLGLAQPHLAGLRLSPRLAAAVAAVPCARGDAAEAQVVTAGYREPSLVFLVGTDLAMAEGVGAADFLSHEGCRVALVGERDEPTFKARAAALGFEPRLTQRVAGFNINGGKRLDIGVYTRP